MSEQEHQSNQVQSSSDSNRSVSSLSDLARGLARVTVARRKALRWMGVERNVDTRRTMLLCATMVAAMIVACSAVLGSVGAAVCGPSWSTVPSAVRASSLSSKMLGVANAPGTSQVWAAG